MMPLCMPKMSVGHSSVAVKMLGSQSQLAWSLFKFVSVFSYWFKFLSQCFDKLHDSIPDSGYYISSDRITL